jgi:TolA-binding protein
MKMNLKALAGIALASAVAGQAYAADAPAAKKPIRHHARTHHTARPSLQSEIEQLRQSMATQQSQIQSLQQQLTARDAQVQQAQQQSQMAAAQAQQQTQAAAAAQQAAAQNTQTVNSLQSAVSDLQTKTVTIAATQKKTLKAIEHPDDIHYKGTTISPKGSFIEFATVNRTRATGSGINTPFTSIPYTASDAGQLSEFEASARQSRIALTVHGNAGSTKLAAHYEMDWLSAGVTSNNNQSNSYTLRVRQLWAQAGFHDGLTLTAGQQWSLATENQHAIDNDTETLPPTIDPQYSVGFVWLRQPSIRLTYKLSPMITFGASAEAEQTLTPSCSATGTSACAVNYLEGQSGTGGGLYNSTTTYSYNLAPALLAKIAFDPKMGHFELFGIERNFRDRVYPNVNPATGKVIDATLASGSGAYNDSTIGGAIGASGRIHTYNNRLEFALKGMYGDGTGRYASSQLSDTTVQPDGQLALLHNFAAYSEVDIKVTRRWTPYLLYGTEYVGHDVFSTATGASGYGLHTLATSGCGTELASTGAYTPTNAGSCSVNNKDMREATLGWWYNFYDGPGGRLREGFQYSWFERNTYTGLNNITPTAIDNVFETSLRYYLP